MVSPQEAYRRAAEDRLKARRWLSRYIKPGAPKAFTKEDLRTAAISELRISKSSFNYASDLLILETGCEHWYDPLRRRSSKVVFDS